MNKIKIGVLCPSEIAFRRFLPALKKSELFEYVGIAFASNKEWSESSRLIDEIDHEIVLQKEKANRFLLNYGGIVYDSYISLLTDNKIDSVYIPLPPSLHYKWAKIALENNKHVLLEKPFTTKLMDTRELIEFATLKRLALHENYMFVFHKQLSTIINMVEEGKIGDLRFIRIAFGFPFRGNNDFRYNREMGGGALFDVGGYTVKLASIFLGDTIDINTVNLNYSNELSVDLYGSCSFSNQEGVVAQLAFGMDNAYKCEIELLGSKGIISTPRIFTAPPDFNPIICLEFDNKKNYFTINSDDQFLHSIEMFGLCINDYNSRIKNYSNIQLQAQLIDSVLTRSSKNKSSENIG